MEIVVVLSERHVVHVQRGLNASGESLVVAVSSNVSLLVGASFWSYTSVVLWSLGENHVLPK
jgi:hypothetical protein